MLVPVPKPISTGLVGFAFLIGYNSSLGRNLIDILGLGLVGFPLGRVDGIGASMSDGVGVEEMGGGSSMMSLESTHVGGLCSRIDKPRNHLDEVSMKKDSRHKRPLQHM